MGHKLSQSCDWHGAKPARSQQNKPEKTSAGNRTKGVNSMEQIIIQLISGAVGGNVIGKVLKNLDLGTLGNSLAGIVGGGLGGQLLGMMGAGGGEAAAGMDIGSIIQSVASGGVGGGVLMAVVGVVKKMMAKG
jgi:uncharacterized membrane protein YeaQ/YmgE (transglycosylase-associated protein family)